MGCVFSKTSSTLENDESVELEKPHINKSGRQASASINVEAEGINGLDHHHHHAGANPRISWNTFRKAEGEQIAAGWPAWLSAAAGEAIQGWIPRRPESFKLLEQIGDGTYSIVHKARDLDSGKIVALKEVRFDKSNPNSVKFMAREINVLRRLDHPNVIKLEGLATSSRRSSRFFLVFEYMRHNLQDLTAGAGIMFTEAQVKCFMQQLLLALDHCHSRGVLHRDVKGANLLLDNGVLKLADFGLATFYHPDHKQRFNETVVTIWYRPPELLLGATDYGAGVDLWSAGCILAELLAGKPIMPGNSEGQQLHMIFRLCGSPSKEYWRKCKLRHEAFEEPIYERRIAEEFKQFSPSSISLLETLLAIEPADRGSASAALRSEFFTTESLPCHDPSSSLPQYTPSKGLNAKDW
ncbi:unnamed protein product [Calypogeia fissa]